MSRLHLPLRRGALALAIALGALVADDAMAQSRPAPAPRPGVAQTESGDSKPVARQVTVKIMCVRATNANNRVDPELQSVMQHLKMLKFRGFSLVDQHSKSLEDGDETSFDLEGGRTIKVSLLQHDGTAAKVRLRMLNAQGTKQLDTTVSIHRDKSFMVAGPKLGDDVLILPVTVSY